MNRLDNKTFTNFCAKGFVSICEISGQMGFAYGFKKTRITSIIICHFNIYGLYLQFINTNHKQ